MRGRGVYGLDVCCICVCVYVCASSRHMLTVAQTYTHCHDNQACTQPWISLILKGRVGIYIYIFVSLKHVQNNEEMYLEIYFVYLFLIYVLSCLCYLCLSHAIRGSVRLIFIFISWKHILWFEAGSLKSDEDSLRGA